LRTSLLLRVRHACLTTAVCALFMVSPVGAVTPATLIGPELNAQKVDVASLNDGTLHYFDEQRMLRSSKIDRFVQLRSIGGEDAVGESLATGIWLTDGQCFSGEWIGPTPDGLGIRWRHPLIGTVVVALDQVARVNWVAGESLAVQNSALVTDTVTLINGDTLTGFVSSLNNHGVALLSGDGGDPVTIPFGRIASMALSNPERSMIEPYHRVTLADGTRVWADRLRITGDRVYCRVIPPGAPAMELEATIMELARIDFWAGGLRLVDLMELPIRTVHEARVFGLIIPVRVAGRAIRMHAPGAVVFELPDGAERFAAVAELDFHNAPKDIADWSDFQVLVSSQDAQDDRFRITGGEPVARINTPISGPELTIQLDPGVNGPILDRLLLRDAVILVNRPGPEPSGDSGR
jgi:hypothetical protein